MHLVCRVISNYPTDMKIENARGSVNTVNVPVITSYVLIAVPNYYYIGFEVIKTVPVQ